ncbi:Reverse transcriptase [Theobroma cacao]|nr:Reverse transcriptase [Theobroma cacao]
MDVKSAFLNGTLSEDILIEQPEGFVEPGKERKVCKLVKALYGLKQAPRAWYDRIDTYLKSQGFIRSANEPTLYVSDSSISDKLIISLYMDDLLITGPSGSILDDFKRSMKQEFEMSNLRETTYFLGLQFHQASDLIFVHQRKYACEMLKRFHMEACKMVETPLVTGAKFNKDDGAPAAVGSTYRSLIGSLLYLTASRPDLMFTASLLSRYMQAPSEIHFQLRKEFCDTLREPWIMDSSLKNEKARS